MNYFLAAREWVQRADAWVKRNPWKGALAGLGVGLIVGWWL